MESKKANSKARIFQRHGMLPSVLFLIGALLSFLGWRLSWEQIHASDQARFEQLSDQIFSTLSKRLSPYESTLHGLRGLSVLSL